MGECLQPITLKAIHGTAVYEMKIGSRESY